MKKEQFENLLTDLYSIYYPQKLEDRSEIRNLIRQYGDGMENIAIQIILVKYNVIGNLGYNSEINRDNVESYASDLIKFYLNGGKINREEWSKKPPVQKDSEKEDIKRQLEEQKTNVEQVIEKKSEEFKSEITLAKEEIQNFFNEKIVEFNNKYESIEKKLKSFNSEGILSYMKIKLTLLNFKAAEVHEFPHDEVFACAGLNDRFILKSSSGMPMAVEVQDITYDFITSEYLTKELTLNRI